MFINCQSLVAENLGSKLPDLVDGELASALGIYGLREHDQIGVRAFSQGSLGPLETQHGCRRGGDGVEGLRDGGAGPVEEVVDTFDESDGTIVGLLANIFFLSHFRISSAV